MKKPHPYTEEQSAHRGRQIFLFEAQGLKWRLTTIESLDGSEPPRSLLSSNGPIGSFWPDYNALTLDSFLTVDGAVTMINRVFSIYEKGRQQGVEDAQANFRKAIGL